MTIPLKFSLGIIAIKTSKNSCCEILVPLILDIPFTSKCLISVTLSLSGYFNKIGCLINFIETNSFFFSQTLAALHRQLRLLTPLYNVRDPYKKEKAHPRVVFLFNDMLVVSTSNADPSPVVSSRLQSAHYMGQGEKCEVGEQGVMRRRKGRSILLSHFLPISSCATSTAQRCMKTTGDKSATNVTKVFCQFSSSKISKSERPHR